jgi:hypothetical protein
MRLRYRICWKIDGFVLCGGVLLMSIMQDIFRGPEISSLPLLMTKNRGPGLKMLRIGNSGLGINIPLENLMISGWLMKWQGGGRLSGPNIFV